MSARRSTAARHWALAAGTPQTFFAGETIPLSVPSVTFTVVGAVGRRHRHQRDATAAAPGTAPTRRRARRPRPPPRPPPPTTTTLPTTTTTQPTTTTTTIAGDLSVAAITPICVADAPYVHVTFGNQPQFNGRPATVTFIDINGNVVGHAHGDLHRQRLGPVRVPGRQRRRRRQPDGLAGLGVRRRRVGPGPDRQLPAQRAHRAHRGQPDGHGSGVVPAGDLDLRESSGQPAPAGQPDPDDGPWLRHGPHDNDRP